MADLEPRDVAEIFADVPSSQIERARLAPDGLPLVELLVAAGLVPSKSEARRAIQGGGIYVNNQREADEKRRISAVDAIGRELLVLRKGRKDYHLVRVVGD
jgi:tyrosyl-tRNA synthetase